MELLSDIIGQTATKSQRERRHRLRRHSRLAGREGTFWRGVKRQDARRIVLAARRYDVATKEFGKRSGALGSIAIEILDYMANLVDYRTGRLDPSIETLKRVLKRSRDAIVRGLKALRTHGFLDWLRRYVPTDNDGAGVQVQQTSNAYRMMMPKRALKLLGRYGQDAPAPDDDCHRRECAAQEIEEHRSSLSLAELPLFDMGANSPLAQSLAKLGSLIQERESAKQTESVSTSIIIGKKDGLTPDLI